MLFTGLIILAVHITLSSARQANCDERGPVCGNDGKTYLTMCQLIWARLEDIDLAVLHEGSCNGKYLMSMLQPAELDDVETGSRNVTKLKGPKINYEKIRALMPVGWPPLGPIFLLDKSPTNSRSQKHTQTRRRKQKNKNILVIG